MTTHADRIDRAVSTVVDVSLFLLLVGVAVLTLLQAPTVADDPASDRAHEITTVLASSTAEIEYTAAPNESPERSVHGTRASLLADATVRDATVDGAEGDAIGIGPDDGFETAVAAEIRPILAGSNWRAEVVVEWQPYPAAHVDGQLRIGHHPPPDADVSIARTAVGSSVSNVTTEARAAAGDENGGPEDGDGYDAVADVTAGAVVERLFPPAQTRAALEEPERRTLTVDRYRAAGDAYGLNLETPAARGEVEHANRKLRAAMAERMAADLREAFESPEAAADALQTETVQVTVRTWSL